MAVYYTKNFALFFSFLLLATPIFSNDSPSLAKQIQHSNKDIDICKDSDSNAEFFEKFLKIQQQYEATHQSLHERWKYYHHHLKRPYKHVLTLDERIKKAAYFNYRERVIIYMDKKILKLRSARMYPAIYTEHPYRTITDFSPTYFRYFANSFERLKIIVQTIQEPQFFLIPLLKLTIKIYEAAKKSAGRRAIYPGRIKRRGMQEFVLQNLYERWKNLKALIHNLSLTLDCSRTIENLIPIIDRGFSIAKQLNGQPARYYLTPNMLNSMIKTIEALIQADMKRVA